MVIILRSQTDLPVYPDNYYPGPYTKNGVCLHNMGAHGAGMKSLDEAKRIQRVNYDYHMATYAPNCIDIMEGFDVFNVNGNTYFLEGRPRWSNCDAFSGMAKLNYQYIGWEVSGNYDVEYPSDVVLQGLAEGLAQHYIDGWITQIHMEGHRDFNIYANPKYGPTSCPGKHLYPHIPAIIKEANRIVNGTTSRKESDPMKINLQPQEKQGSLFVWQIPDAFTHIENPRLKADYMCWLHIYNENPNPIEIQIFGNPSLSKHPWMDTIKGYSGKGYDVYQLNGNQHFNGALIVKSNKNTIAPTLTLLRLDV